MKVNEKQARELFEAIGYTNAGDWSEKKLRAKLNDAAVFADAEKPEDGDMANLFLNVSKAAQDGEAVELDGGGKPASKKAGKPASKKDGKSKAERNGFAANGKADKGKKSSGKTKGKGEGRPGVIATVIESLRTASEITPMSKKDLGEILARKFPERSVESMMKTVNVQVPFRLRKDKNIKVQSNEEGYWIGK